MMFNPSFSYLANLIVHNLIINISCTPCSWGWVLIDYTLVGGLLTYSFLAEHDANVHGGHSHFVKYLTTA